MHSNRDLAGNHCLLKKPPSGRLFFMTDAALDIELGRTIIGASKHIQLTCVWFHDDNQRVVGDFQRTA